MLNVRRRFLIGSGAAALMLGCVPDVGLAQGAKASSAAELAREIDRLKPGQWVLAPQVAPSGPILIYVDLSKQIAMVYRNGVRIGATTVSTGKDGHETPTGVFTILQKDAKHRSSKYNNAPMPFQQRLTWDGVALHAGGLPGYPESHGCVHLPYEFARQLFTLTSLGITVVVQGDAAAHVKTEQNSLLAPFDDHGAKIEHQPLANGEQFRWTPELATDGPLTIIISRLDQRVVVLRNGVEIGRSLAQINDDDTASHVISLIQKNGQPHWVYVGLPERESDEGQGLDEDIINRVHLPKPFYEQVKASLRPGATILVTNSRVGAEPLQRLTIMDAVVPRP